MSSIYRARGHGVTAPSGTGVKQLTILLSPDEHHALKQLALDHDTTMTQIIKKWIRADRPEGSEADEKNRHHHRTNAR